MLGDRAVGRLFGQEAKTRHSLASPWAILGITMHWEHLLSGEEMAPLSSLIIFTAPHIPQFSLYSVYWHFLLAPTRILTSIQTPKQRWMTGIWGLPSFFDRRIDATVLDCAWRQWMSRRNHWTSRPTDYHHLCPLFGCPGFKYRLKDRLFWLIGFVISLTSSRHVLR